MSESRATHVHALLLVALGAVVLQIGRVGTYWLLLSLICKDERVVTNMLGAVVAADRQGWNLLVIIITIITNM